MAKEKSGPGTSPPRRPAKDGASAPKRYEELLGEIKERVRSAQVRAVVAVNRELVLLCWSIGRDILDR